MQILWQVLSTCDDDNVAGAAHRVCVNMRNCETADNATNKAMIKLFDQAISNLGVRPKVFPNSARYLLFFVL